MRKIALIIFCLFCIPSVSFAEDDCPLKGKWYSNEKATLEQMDKYGNLTEKQRKLLSNKFFGKLTIEYSCTEATIYYNDTVKTEKYKITKRNGNTLEVELSSTKEQITLAGDCYLISLEPLTFSEVFCKAK